MATPSASSLDVYRDEADRFIAALDEEYYLHYAGLKETFELEPIYERFSDLTTLDAARELAGAAKAGGAGEVELWHFACEGYLGNLTRGEAEEIAGLEASLEASVDGETIPYRMLRPTIANEADRGRRERLEAARIELAEEQLMPRWTAHAEKRREGTRALGAPTYSELYERFGFPLEELAAQARAFLDETEALHVAAFDRLLRQPRRRPARRGPPARHPARLPRQRLGRGLPRRPHGARAAVDARRARHRPAARRTTSISTSSRGRRRARAPSAPRSRCPQRVMLVIKPMGGPDDWHAFFHEAGHAEHFAHVSPDLPVEFRRLGDNSVTEGWAMLFEHLVDDPAWLSRRLDFARPEDFAEESAVSLLYVVRRYAGKLLYELELHGDVELESMRARYVELLGDATKIEPSATDFLADVDEGFYCTCYLRAWAFHTQIESFLRQELGRAWFTRPEAGSLLRELWAEGQRLTAAELLDQVAGAKLELAAVGERIEEEVTV